MSKMVVDDPPASRKRHHPDGYKEEVYKKYKQAKKGKLSSCALPDQNPPEKSE
jgi:hypothetical protein